MQVAFLGHVISVRGVLVDPGKVKNALNWKLPTDVSETIISSDYQAITADSSRIS
jgi:hypothetical protein